MAQLLILPHILSYLSFQKGSPEIVLGAFAADLTHFNPCVHQLFHRFRSLLYSIAEPERFRPLAETATDAGGDHLFQSFCWVKGLCFQEAVRHLLNCGSLTLRDIACAQSFCDVPRFSVANSCLLYTSPSPRDQRGSRMPSSA